MVGSSQPLENRFPPHPRRLLWRSCTRVFLAGGVRSLLCCSFSVRVAGWAVMRAACGEGKPRPEQAVSVFAGVSTQLGRPDRLACCSVGAVNSSLSWHEVRLTSSGQFFESGVRVVPVSQSSRNVSAPRYVMITCIVATKAFGATGVGYCVRINKFKRTLCLLTRCFMSELDSHSTYRALLETVRRPL